MRSAGRRNDTVREGLAEEGVLRGRTLAVDRLVNRRLTRVQASDIRSYEPGDTVVFHRDVFGCRANDVCIVMDHDDGRVVLAHPDGERRFRPSGNAARYLGLYDTERIELRAGDRIRWTRNRKAPPARFGHPPAPDLVNGGEAEILEIGYKRVRFRDGDREFRLALTDPQLRHLDHAWCSTVHSAQGPDGAGGDRRAGRGRLGRPRAAPCRAQPDLGGVPAADRRPGGADRAPGGARRERRRGAGGAGDRPCRAPRGGPRRVCGSGGGLAGTSAGGRGDEYRSVLPAGLRGHQEGRFFHGYYDGYCYLPLYIFCGRHLLAAKLRRANIDASAGAVEEVARIVRQLRRRWPHVRILLRADSGFAREALMAWCEANRVDYLFGLARNPRLVAALEAAQAAARAEAEAKGRPARRYKDFLWSTRDSWSRRRRVVGKAEWTGDKANPRFVVTSLRPQEARSRRLYETLYCARGEMENRIKECQLDLFADRTSARTMRANQLRLWFASMAYVLLCALRRIGLAHTRFARASCGSIRLKLLKIAALVRISVRRIKFAMASGCPYQSEFQTAHARLSAAAA